MMHWYQWMALAALTFCLSSLLLHFLRLVRKGKPEDLSRPAGTGGKAVIYAFTGAMSPAKKESAFLHLPTYTAGLLFHTGTFLSFLIFFMVFFNHAPAGILAFILSAYLMISTLSGNAILLKRIFTRELRALSNPDDYISNILVTLFQVMTMFVLLTPTLTQSYTLPFLQSYSHTVLPSYYTSATLLLLYVPVGKLRHTVYFFAARYHLGNFYGWRGVWPPRTVNKMK